MITPKGCPPPTVQAAVAVAVTVAALWHIRRRRIRGVGPQPPPASVPLRNPLGLLARRLDYGHRWDNRPGRATPVRRQRRGEPTPILGALGIVPMSGRWRRRRQVKEKFHSRRRLQWKRRPLRVGQHRRGREDRCCHILRGRRGVMQGGKRKRRREKRKRTTRRARPRWRSATLPRRRHLPTALRSPQGFPPVESARSWR